MDAIVTARIPVELKEQGNAILREIGSSPTKLINAAYAYVLRHRALPIDEEPPLQQDTIRNLTHQQREELESSLASMSVPVPPSFWEQLGGRSYQDLIAEGRLSDYEALA